MKWRHSLSHRSNPVVVPFSAQRGAQAAALPRQVPLAPQVLALLRAPRLLARAPRRALLALLAPVEPALGHEHRVADLRVVRAGAVAAAPVIPPPPPPPLPPPPS